MKDLEQVRTALIAAFGGDASKLPMVNARLILRTGVSLTKLDPRHVHDPKRVDAVLFALREMGFDMESRSMKTKG
jgi:hypothetical protein